MSPAPAPARRVFLLGHRGMLGHGVQRYLEQSGCQVRVSLARHDGTPDSPLVREVVESDCDAVVNCVGVVPQRAHGAPAELLTTNAVLPQHLAVALGPSRLLVHPSTDCVFSGRAGPYRVDATPDPSDGYGLSKRLGELCLAASPSVVVLRGSIVGPDLGAPAGLLSWYLAQPGPVNGFTDRLWNGITSLQWAKLCLSALRGQLRPGLHQPGFEPALSKCEMLQLFSEVYGHAAPVQPRDSGHPIDRRLVPTLPCPPLREQLRELRAWYEA